MPQHANFWDVVDGYESKDAQDKKRLAALEHLFVTMCDGEELLALVPCKWRELGAALLREEARRFFNEIADALERVVEVAPGILRFPVSDVAPGQEEVPRGHP